jgi:hypothetical protein
MYYSVRQTFTCVVTSVLWYTNQVGCFYLYAYSEWVSVMSVIQHSKRMRRVILSSVACRAPLFFSTLPHKRHDLKKLLNIKCVFLFSLQLFFSDTFLILRRTEQDVGFHVKHLSFLLGFTET